MEICAFSWARHAAHRFLSRRIRRAGASNIRWWKVHAFHAWTLLYNFEWADGSSQRYGLTYVDFRDQKRTVKDSGLWYGRVAAANRLDVS